jgi:hypothetical protein
VRFGASVANVDVAAGRTGGSMMSAGAVVAAGGASGISQMPPAQTS